jgi:hypothetical protein
MGGRSFGERRFPLPVRADVYRCERRVVLLKAHAGLEYLGRVEKDLLVAELQKLPHKNSPNFLSFWCVLVR